MALSDYDVFDAYAVLLHLEERRKRKVFAEASSRNLHATPMEIPRLQDKGDLPITRKPAFGHKLFSQGVGRVFHFETIPSANTFHKGFGIRLVDMAQNIESKANQ